MTKKNKFLVTSFSVAIAAAASCLAIALMPKTSFRTMGQTDEVWKHYSERMPGINPGIKEYWVSCDSHSYQFSEPETDGTIQDVSGWDTSEFAVDDARYTYQCTHKIADSALAGTSADTSITAPSHGFTSYQAKTYTADGYQGFDVDISGYDYITFALRHNMEFLCLFGGASSGSDEQDVVITKPDKNFVMWQDVWYYISLERNAEGKWDAYVGRYNFAKRYSASIKMGDQAKNGTNLKDMVGVWNFLSLSGGEKIYSTAVYGAEKGHHYSYPTDKISPNGTCSVCGATTTDRDESTVDLTKNKYGAKLINTNASADVSTWGNGYQGGTKLNAFAKNSIAYANYGWNSMAMYLPKIDFSKFSRVSFDLGHTKILGSDGTAEADPSGNPVGFKIGFEQTTANQTQFASTWDNAEVTGGKLVITPVNGKLEVEIHSYGSINSITTTVTDADIINGSESLVIYGSAYLNDSTSYAYLFTNLRLQTKVSLFGYEKVDASQITDTSIKEFYTTKQVRRLEQQDEWKSPIGSASNEVGHADFYKSSSREVLHLSAHYESTEPKYAYNSGFSEWRFNHVQAGLTAISFDYMYFDRNTDTSNDGVGDVHTMCQWYGAAYQGRSVSLIPDGEWHRATITGEAYDTNFFVMKIFHFTGDILISNIAYSTSESDVTDASIKEFYTTKQVRRLEQQDHWKTDPDYSTYNNESGHAEYVKFGTKDAIHLSAHYASDDPKYGYNSGWSEWRFQHHTTGLTSVTFDYKYTDSNSDASNDGLGNAHTMSQWYGASYEARAMVLVNDGQWHSITVTGAAFDTDFFVMKIFHFTGDIYISNIIYA